VLPLALVGGAVLPACSLKARSTLSATSLEARIGANLALVYHIPAPPVRCPSGVLSQAGSRFTCTATLDGQQLPLAGTVTDARGHFQLRPTDAVVVTSAAEAQIGERLTKAIGPRVVLSCAAPTLLVAKVGRDFGCTAIIAGVRRQVVVTVTSLAGRLRYKVLPYKPAA
jgi:hypothetical protein